MTDLPFKVVQVLFSLATYFVVGMGTFVLMAAVIYALATWFLAILYIVCAIVTGFIVVTIYKALK